jgi:copper chaperone NosL
LTAARWARAAAILALTGAAACGRPQAADAPPEIVYGEDVCDYCGMIISDARFAAALIVDVEGREEPRRFDDIGDMLAFQAATDLPVRRGYVHDYDTLDWLPANAAYFVVAPDVATPMDHGLVAFATRPRAAAFAAERDTDVLSYTDLVEAPAGVYSHP